MSIYRSGSGQINNGGYLRSLTNQDRAKGREADLADGHGVAPAQL
ncbi:hypothetical protein [Agrobacterium tumefaciens]|nr:hypothetical protein [Agrobacterium tumefaciens]